MTKTEEGRWLTYEELAQKLGSSVPAARIMAVRRKFPRRTPNAYGERARVLVPENLEISRRRTGHVGATVRDTVSANHPAPNGHDLGHVAQAIEALREQLRITNDRADRAEQRGDAERTLRLVAEKRADAIRAEMDSRRDWSLPRRLRWAFGYEK